MILIKWGRKAHSFNFVILYTFNSVSFVLEKWLSLSRESLWSRGHQFIELATHHHLRFAFVFHEPLLEDYVRRSRMKLNWFFRLNLFFHVFFLNDFFFWLSLYSFLSCTAFKFFFLLWGQFFNFHLIFFIIFDFLWNCYFNAFFLLHRLFDGKKTFLKVFNWLPKFLLFDWFNPASYIMLFPEIGHQKTGTKLCFTRRTHYIYFNLIT